MKKIFLSLFSALLLVSCGSGSKWQQTTDADLHKVLAGAPFDMKVSMPRIPDKVFDVMDYGAVNNGTVLLTEVFQKAIDEASAAGGGTVLIPDGVYLTGPIVLKSNVRLYAEQNALVIFSPDFSLYPILETSFEGLDTRRCQSPISALNAENIAICGKGTFNGSGDAWRAVKKAKLTASQWKKKAESGGVVTPDGKEWYPDSAALYGKSLCVDQNVPVGLQSDEEWEAIRSFLRPVMLSFVNCRNVLLEGVCFENSPAWNLHPLMCENLVLSRLTVRNPWYSQNGDGVDVESCRNVVIADCSFDVGDDAICMKSGKNEDGRRRGVADENIVVDGCKVYHGHGGFVVGSEMSGGVKNVWVKNCMFLGTDVGLRFKSTRGRGGIVENIFIDNICMNAIPNDALLFDLYYGGKGAGEETAEEIAARMAAAVPLVDETTPQFRNISIENVICSGAKRAVYFNGLPEMPIRNVCLKNINMIAEEGAVFNKTENVTIENVIINGEEIH